MSSSGPDQGRTSLLLDLAGRIDDTVSVYRSVRWAENTALASAKGKFFTEGYMSKRVLFISLLTAVVLFAAPAMAQQTALDWYKKGNESWNLQ